MNIVIGTTPRAFTNLRPVWVDGHPIGEITIALRERYSGDNYYWFTPAWGGDKWRFDRISAFRAAVPDILKTAPGAAA